MKKFLATAMVSAGMLATPVAAATYSNLYGVIDEGPRVMLPGPADFKLGDFGGRASRTVLEFKDDASIYGRVYHTKKRRYSDAFTINASKYTFDLILTAVDGSRGYDLDFNVNGNRGRLDAANNQMRWNDLRGDIVVNLFGPSSRGNGQWRVDVANIAAVPIPASGLLLLGGLAGFMTLRRRSKG